MSENCKKTSKHELSLKQLRILLFSGLIVDTVLVYFDTNVSFTAYEKTWSSIINTIIVLVFAYVFLNNIKFKENSIIFGITAFFAFVLNGGIVLLDSEKFVSYASDVQYSGLLIAIMIIIVCIYAIKCAQHTLSRTCAVFIAIFIVFSLILFLANANKIDITNLNHAWQAKSGALVASFMTFKFPASILLFTVIPTNEKIKVNKTILPVMLIICAIQIVFAIVSELVFAQQISEYSQPIYALAKTAQLSVFEHLEPIYFCVFLFALIIKACVLFLGALYSIKPLLKNKTIEFQTAFVILTGIICLIIVSFVSVYITSLFASVICIIALITYKINFKSKSIARENV